MNIRLKTPNEFLSVNKKESFRKCKNCGKFISDKDMQELKKVSFHFTPDTEVTIEEFYWYHNKC